MCGISGFISNSPRPAAIIHRMTNVIRHRGPDDEGFLLFGDYHNRPLICTGDDTPPEIINHRYSYHLSGNIKDKENLPVFLALGHRRLSILDLSPLGHQPMSTPDNRYWIVFNGEIYNHEELRNELKAAGYSFQSRSDTEVILAAYSVWGSECFKHFNGMWSVAIYDTAERELVLCRDRYGVKPLYYWIAPDGCLYFGSEIKQFTVVPEWTANLNTARAYDFLSYGITDHTSETLFAGVNQLRGGELLRIKSVSGELNNPSVIRWYDLNQVKVSRNFDSAAEYFYDMFRDAVRLRLNADVPVGTGLSGGLDSSSIVCTVSELLQDRTRKNQQTFTACSEDKRFDERHYVEKVIERSNAAPNYIYPSLDEFLDIMKTIIWHHDEPLTGASIFAEWKVFGLVSTTPVKVTLDGHGADELLAGYYSFFRPHFSGLFRNLNWISLIKEIRAGRTRHSGNPAVSFKNVAEAVMPGILRRGLKDLLGKNKSGSDWLEAGKLGIEEYDLFNHFGFSQRDLNSYSASLFFNTSLPMQLRWCDRDSMAHSIESRAPFLDFRLVEFIFSCPPEYKIFNGETKHILRRGLRDTLPASIVNRQDKLGFVTPESAWVCEHNQELFITLAENSVSKARGIFSGRAIDHINDMVYGRIKYDPFIWRVICFAEWLDVFSVNLP